MREMKDISMELEWMQMEEPPPESAATGSGRAGTDETTLIQREEPISFVAAVDHFPVHLRISNKKKN